VSIVFQGKEFKMSPLAIRPKILGNLPTFQVKGQYNPYVKNLIELIVTDRNQEAEYAFNGLVLTINP
jgi:hypothetical protein